jgi:tRNA threonylcarbamoyladenosine biosynthesis protein TsaE
MGLHKTASVTETYALGERFARSLSGGEIIGLSGPLGSGKTEFVRGIAGAFSIRHAITSPTFTLSKTYAVAGSRVRHLVHVDAYRLETPENISATEAMDLWGRPDAITLIEWPERLQGVAPKEMEIIKIDRGMENMRIFEFSLHRENALKKTPRKKKP